MSSTVAKLPGFTQSKLLSKLVQNQADANASAKYKDKLTSGLSSTHGLHKLSDAKPSLSHADSNLKFVLEKICSFPFKEYFLDFDRLRKGRVPIARFQSALGMTNVELNSSEMQILAKKYTTDDDSIDYTKFCEDVNKVFRREEKGILKTDAKGGFERDEARMIVSVLKDLRDSIKSNRILLRPSFADYDRTNTQHITVQQFSRVLKQMHLMPSEEQFDLLCQRYLDKGNTREVNYVKFCHDVDKPEDMMEQLGIEPRFEESKKKVEFKVDTNSSVFGTNTKSNFFKETTKGINVLENRFSKPTINLANDPNDVEERLQTRVVMKRVRIGEFFKDYDKLRKGKVTPNQFTTALAILNFPMTDEEYDALIEKYKTDDGMVNYAAFVDNIDSAFTIKGIDKKPSHVVTQLDTKTILEKSKKKLDYDEDEQNSMMELMEAYRNVIVTRRLNLKPIFQDFDKTKSGHVTKSQFVRVLNQLRIDLSPELLSLLLKKYMDRGNADEVNYFEFINDVDRPEDMFGAGRDFNHSYDYFSVTQPHKVASQIVALAPEDIDDVLSRIRTECSQKRIRLQEFFRDFDRLRAGNVTKSQFRIALSMAKIDLSNEEYKLITDHYASDKTGMVRWRDFCDDVDKVFTHKGLEKDATFEVTSPDINLKYGKREAPKSDKKLAERLVVKFKNQLQRERLDAKSFFQSWDRHNRFKISPKQFRQVLAQFGFDMTDAEAAALSAYYANQDGEVEYLKFLNDSNPDVQVQVEETKSKYFSRGWKFDGVTEYENLMLKIKSIVKKGRIRLLEYFQDHDILRKGYIPYMKFKGVLRAQNIELTDKEYDILIEKFQMESDSKLINYVYFEEEIDRIFTKRGLEKEPTTRVQEFKPTNLIDPDDVLTDEEEKVLEDLLVRIGTETKNRRLLLKPLFQDKDKIRCGVVANTRFRSIFDTLKLPLSEEEFYIISKRFVAGAPNEIKYLEFDNLLKTYSGDDSPF